MSDTIVLAWLCGLTFAFVVNSYWIGKLETRIDRIEWRLNIWIVKTGGEL